MDTASITAYAQLGGTVVVVVLFLSYLTKRDDKWTDSLKANSNANVLLARALQRLTDKIETNSVVNVSNTKKIDENIEATVENTEAIKTKKK